MPRITKQSIYNQALSLASSNVMIMHDAICGFLGSRKENKIKRNKNIIQSIYRNFYLYHNPKNNKSKHPDSGDFFKSHGPPKAPAVGV